MTVEMLQFPHCRGITGWSVSVKEPCAHSDRLSNNDQDSEPNELGFILICYTMQSHSCGWQELYPPPLLSRSSPISRCLDVKTF